MPPSADIEQLVESRDQFLGFVQRRISDPVLAEDILQTSLLKAVQNYDGLQDHDRLVPWFYSILRNAVTDAHRSRSRTPEVALPDNLELEDEPEIAATSLRMLSSPPTHAKRRVRRSHRRAGPPE